MAKTNKDKPRQRSESPRRRARNQKVIEASIVDGKTTTEIANEFGLARQTVSTILNHSDDAKEILKRGQDRLLKFVDKALDAYEGILGIWLTEPASAKDVATKVLKTHGIVTETTEVNLSLPEPTVIEKKDGTQIILGAKGDE